jgi:hypothetical protein
VQVYSLRRQAARQKPAQSPVAPKKAIVRVEDIFCFFLLVLGGVAGVLLRCMAACKRC